MHLLQLGGGLEQCGGTNQKGMPMCSHGHWASELKLQAKFVCVESLDSTSVCLAGAADSLHGARQCAEDVWGKWSGSKLDGKCLAASPYVPGWGIVHIYITKLHLV